MKSISFWAKNHKASARVIIILNYILLNAIGIFLGDILFSMNIFLSPLFYAAAILITVLALIIYPSKRIKYSKKNFYFQQKTADIILFIATFLFIIYAGNSFYNSDFKGSDRASASTSIYLSSNVSSTAIIEKKVVSKKQSTKKLRNVIREFRKKYKSSTKEQKTLYIIISVLVAAGLGLGVSALACNIACSGSEALAFIVLFLGLGGIIFGLVKIIQRINRGKPKNDMVKPVQ